MARPRIVPLQQLQRGVRSKTRELRMPPQLARLRGSSPDTAAISRDGVPVFAEVGDRKPCQLSKGKEGLRDCHVELVFVGAAQSLRRGVPPGNYLRFCTQRKGQRKGQGQLLAVRDHVEAMEKSRAYCKCSKGGGESRASCATKAGAVTSQDVKVERKKAVRRR